MDHEVKRSRPSWSTRLNPISTKNTKISWAWWYAPVVLATQEAEAGELLELRSCHCTLAWVTRVKLRLKKQQQQKFVRITIQFRLTQICIFHNFKHDIRVMWLGALDHLRLGVLDQPGQNGETPSPLKIQKLAGCGGTCL